MWWKIFQYIYIQKNSNFSEFFFVWQNIPFWLLFLAFGEISGKNNAGCDDRSVYFCSSELKAVIKFPIYPQNTSPLQSKNYSEVTWQHWIRWTNMFSKVLKNSSYPGRAYGWNLKPWIMMWHTTGTSQACSICLLWSELVISSLVSARGGMLLFPIKNLQQWL